MTTCASFSTADMPRFNQAQCENALGRLQAGQRQNEVAQHFHVIQSTISRLLSRDENTVSTADRPRYGRPMVTIPVQNRLIRASHLRHRFQSATTKAKQILTITHVHQK